MSLALPAVLPDGSAPYLVNIPADVLTVGAGGEAVEFAEAAMGVALDPWQRWAIERSLAETVLDGQVVYSAFEVGLILPRQNGKNYVLESLQLAMIYLFGDQTLVHSAHKLDTSVEHFNRLKSLFQESPDLSSLLLPQDRSFVTSNGKESIRLNSGQRILFKARYRGGGRGFTGDAIFLDEAYDLPPSAMGATVPTLSTRPRGQIYYTSSAPHSSSQVLHAVRKRAEQGDPLDRLFWAEWGNGPGVLDLDPVEDCDAYMAALRQANPAVSTGRISEAYIAQEMRTFSGSQELVDEYVRERMGVATLPPSALQSVVPLEAWASCGLAVAADSVPEIVSGLCWSLDVTEDRGFASVAVAGHTAAGRLQVEVPMAQSVGDAWAGSEVPGWVVAYAIKLFEELRVPVRIEKSSPAGAYISRLEAAGVPVEALSSQDHSHCFGQLLDAVAMGELQHLCDASLTGQVQVAETRVTGDSALWARRRSRNISGLVAVTLAAGGVPEWQAPKKKSIGMAFG